MSRAIHAAIGAILLIPLLARPALAEGPCSCRDLPDMKQQLERSAKSGKAWRKVWEWVSGQATGSNARRPGPGEDLIGKFNQLANAPESDWDRIIGEALPPSQAAGGKLAGLNRNGAGAVNPDFVKQHCDDVIEAEKKHETAHLWYLGVAESGNPKQRAESEVASYGVQNQFLDQKATDLSLRCTTRLDASMQDRMKEAVAQRDRLGQAENRVMHYATTLE